MIGVVVLGLASRNHGGGLGDGKTLTSAISYSRISVWKNYYRTRAIKDVQLNNIF